jgi:inorganic pyrophosphatase
MRYGSKAYWCFHMADDGQDEKVICVPVSDPIWNSLK